MNFQILQAKYSFNLMNIRIIRFVFTQINEIRQGGLFVLLRKLTTASQELYEILLVILCIPAVLVIRLLRPFILIRFGHMLSDRIGHFAINTEVYLCRRDLNRNNKEPLDLFYYQGPVANQQLKKMWDRVLRIFGIARFLDNANRLLPGWEKHVISMENYREGDHLLGQTPAHLYFTVEEEELGQNALKKLGITDSNSFVCFALRDSLYLNTAYPNLKWDYHNYRNVSIDNYIPVAKELARRGYFVLRMGSVVKEKLNIFDARIIDYATKARTEFLDIFLCAKCKFFLVTSIGLASVGTIFRRPIAWTNFIPLEYAWTWNPDDLLIPKKLWLKKEHRFLRFKEIFNSGIRKFLKTEEYEQEGIEVIENTPEEITAITIEMDERLKGNWQTTEEDEQLQKRFWVLFKPRYHEQIFKSRIGTEFLRQNRDLLE